VYAWVKVSARERVCVRVGESFFLTRSEKQALHSHDIRSTDCEYKKCNTHCNAYRNTNCNTCCNTHCSTHCNTNCNAHCNTCLHHSLQCCDALHLTATCTATLTATSTNIKRDDAIQHCVHVCVHPCVRVHAYFIFLSVFLSEVCHTIDDHSKQERTHVFFVCTLYTRRVLCYKMNECESRKRKKEPCKEHMSAHMFHASLIASKPLSQACQACPPSLFHLTQLPVLVRL